MKLAVKRGKPLDLSGKWTFEFYNIMNLDSRKRFMESSHAKQWFDIVASNAFGAAVETAMLVTQQNLGPAPDMGAAAANAWKMQGAQKFLENLMSLTESTKPKTPPPLKKLNYAV